MTIIRNKAYIWRPKGEDGDHARSLEFEDFRGRGDDGDGSIYLTWSDGRDDDSVMSLTSEDLAELVAIGRVILGTASDDERALTGEQSDGGARLRSVD